jgi:hypothetical protein
MKIVVRKLLIGLLVLASLAMTRSASAGFQQEVVYGYFGTSSIPLSTYFSVNTSKFALFNPVLGTLESVTIVLTQTATVTSSVTNQSAVTSNGYKVYSADQITATGLGGNQATATLQSNTVTGTIATKTMLTNLGTLSGTTSSNAVSESALADYIGKGTSSMNVTGSTITTGQITSGDNNIYLTFGGTAMVSGSVAIYYEYLPNTVPEPASLAMLALGLGTITVVRRMKRKTRD